jgi:hypothetical protein
VITGAHAILYSTDADADRAFLREVLGFPSTDAGGGWLIFGLPPAEVAVHPAERGGAHELYLMCDDIEALRRSLEAKDVPCSDVHEERWGLLVQVTLPGGGRLGIYEPRHPRAPRPRSRAAKATARKRATPPRRGTKSRPRGARRKPRA